MNHHVLFNLILCIVTGINKNFFVVVSGYNSGSQRYVGITPVPLS